jgi:hypothetical protein
MFKCRQYGMLNQLKASFYEDDIFLSKLFESENREIEKIFPKERLAIISKFINISLYIGANYSQMILQSENKGDLTVGKKQIEEGLSKLKIRVKISLEEIDKVYKTVIKRIQTYK